MIRILGLIALGVAAVAVAGVLLSSLEPKPPGQPEDDGRLRDLDERLAAGGQVVFDAEGGFCVR
jgi:hypothetical protein